MKKILTLFGLLFVSLMMVSVASAVTNEMTLFEDDFESGTIDPLKWSSTLGDPEITSDPSYVNNGDYAVVLDGGQNPDDLVMSVIVDTTGYNNVELSYARLLESLEDDNGFVSEYSADGGSSWSTLEDVWGTESYSTETFSLSPDADDISNLIVRFSVYGGATNDLAAFDDVKVTGQDLDTPEIVSIGSDPKYPTCTDDVEVCATVTDISDIDFVDITCTAGNTKITKFNVAANGDEYCASFSEGTMNPEDAMDFVCSVTASDEFDNEVTSGDTTVTTYDCADPIAVITGDLTCDEGTVATLSGSDSSDTVDNDLTYLWTGVDSSNGDEATVNCVDDGTVDVTLTVTDDAGHDDTAEESVTVENVDPVAIISGASTGDEGSDVTLTASATDDGALDTHTFMWTVDTVETAGDTLVVSCVDEELISVSLTATDDDGGVDTETHDVQCENVDPTVDAGEDQTVPQGTEVTLSPTTDDDGVNDVLTVTYDWGNGYVSESSHTYCAVGDHTVTVMVADEDGGSSTDTVVITVTNVLPTITSTGEPYVGLVDEVLSFTATGSDVCDDKLSISWDFAPEGNYVSDWNAYWSAPFSGTVGLTITDENGGEATADVQVDVYTYKIKLDAGWNLVSFPLVAEDDDSKVSTVFASIVDDVEVVWAYTWDESAGRNVWTKHRIDGSFDAAADLMNVVPGYGYYVKMINEADLYLNGEMDYQVGGEDNDPVFGMPPSVTLAMDSWNLIGTYGLESAPVYSALVSLEDQNHNAYYDIIYDENGSYPYMMSSTEGYWLSVKKVFDNFNTIEYKANYNMMEYFDMPRYPLYP